MFVHVIGIIKKIQDTTSDPYIIWVVTELVKVPTSTLYEFMNSIVYVETGCKLAGSSPAYPNKAYISNAHK